MSRIAIIPGSFDPITKGHLDIIERTAKIFDEVYVLVSINDEKHSLFTIDEKIAFVKDAASQLGNIKVDSYQGLTVDYYKKIGAATIVRGVRDVRDFSTEEEYDYYNRSFCQEINTFLMFSSEEFKRLSSSALKILLLNDVDISKYVTPLVYEALKKKFNK